MNKHERKSVFFCAVLGAAITGLSCTAISAEGLQRVLLSFDDAGHQVRKIVRTDARVALRTEASDSTVAMLESDLDILKTRLEPGVATLVWFDEGGRWHANTSEPDPRVAHAPAHINGRNEGRLGEVAGAWLVTGPEIARFLTILLPTDPSLALGFEQWDVNLRVE